MACHVAIPNACIGGFYADSAWNQRPTQYLWWRNFGVIKLVYQYVSHCCWQAVLLQICLVAQWLSGGESVPVSGKGCLTLFSVPQLFWVGIVLNTSLILAQRDDVTLI